MLTPEREKEIRTLNREVLRLEDDGAITACQEAIDIRDLLAEIDKLRTANKVRGENENQRQKIFELMKEWEEEISYTESWLVENNVKDEIWIKNAEGYIKALKFCYNSLEHLVWPEILENKLKHVHGQNYENEDLPF